MSTSDSPSFLVYPLEDAFLVNSREIEIIRELLHKKGVKIFRIVFPEKEGKPLGNTFEDKDVWSTSGYIVTPDSIHSFWLDWNEHNGYTLGDEFDKVYSEEEINTSKDGEYLLEIQQQLDH